MTLQTPSDDPARRGQAIWTEIATCPIERTSFWFLLGSTDIWILDRYGERCEAERQLATKLSIEFITCTGNCIGSMEPPTPPSKKQKVTQPPVPEGWDRCHAYLERKGRFCRQEVLRMRTITGQYYCGNHQHLYSSSTSTSTLMPSATTPQDLCKIQDINAFRKRIPCPIDSTHHIYEDMLEKHIEKCPKTMEQRKQQQQSFYRPNCNCGGHGPLINLFTAEVAEKRDLDWAKRVAVRILETYNKVFPIPSLLSSKDMDITQISRHDICQDTTSIPLFDLSMPEFNAGFRSAVADYRIKSGGRRHLHQQASMIGHLRRIGVIEALDGTDSATANQDTNHDNVKSRASHPSHPDQKVENNHETATRTILEMGAGRGMTGLVIAGVSGANQHLKTHLTMIERSASRSRAEKFLRKVKQYESSFPTTTNYMNLSNVQWNRIQCDLSHVDIDTALIPTIETKSDHTNGQRPRRTRHDLVVVAKHLCGVGTDLALKSIEPIRESVSAVIMSTCCHGVCNWHDYVGREYLLEAIRKTDIASPRLLPFGEDEFDLLRLWSAGTVLDVNVTEASSKGHDMTKEAKLEVDDDSNGPVLDNDDEDVHRIANESPATGSDITVTKVVEALNLKCGAQGLGRACQRLIDYGRCEYLRRVIFDDTNQTNAASIPNDNDVNPNHHNNSHVKVELVYYVPESITPQNALLIAYKSIHTS